MVIARCADSGFNYLMGVRARLNGFPSAFNLPSRELLPAAYFLAKVLLLAKNI